MSASSYHSIRRFMVFLKPYWKKGLAAFLFTMLSVGLQLPMPFLTRYLLDKVIVQKSFALLNLIGIVMVGTLLVNEAANFFQNYLFSTFRGRVLFDIRAKLFEHIQKVSVSVFQGRSTGYLMSRLSEDVEAVQGLLAHTVVAALQNLIIFSAGIVCTLWIHPKLALICFSILPVYLLSLIIFNDRIRGLSRENREKMALIQSDLQELISGITVIKAFTAEGRANVKLVSRIKEAVRVGIKLDLTASLASISSTLISAVGPIVLIWYGCGEIMRGNMTVGGLLAFNSFIGFLFGPVRGLYDLNIGVQRSLAAVERIFEIFDIKPEEDKGEAITIEQGKVVISNVSFGYDNDTTVLHEISLTIEPGTIMALVGRSGSGKTTLSSLLLKFHQPNQGQIAIDGYDINSISTKSLRQQIGLVAQDAFLFSGNIWDNIRFGCPDASAAEIENAARIANAHDFITNLPEGYQTVVGERGCTLSGGQRQRITIARAILKNPKILIFDEATSQIDNESERLIQSAMEAFMKNRTSIVIAHRLSTIQRADKIFVMEKGKIVEQGTHQELFELGGVYRELYQAGFDKA